MLNLQFRLPSAEIVRSQFLLFIPKIGDTILLDIGSPNYVVTKITHVIWSGSVIVDIKKVP